MEYTQTNDLFGYPILERMKAFAVPAVSIAVISEGRLSHALGYGRTAHQGGDPLSASTLFQACSISKLLCAITVLHLAEMGDIDLDVDVNDMLSTWKVPPNGNWQPRVTPRQILSHSAGLTTHGFPGYAKGADLPALRQVLNGEAPANTLGVRVDVMPGLTYRYSGGGWVVLQLLLDELTGTPYHELVQDLVLWPLEMKDSTFAQPLPRTWEGRAAHGHRRDGTPLPGGWHTYPEQSAAGLWTTSIDLAKLVIAIQTAASGHRVQTLSTGVAKLLLTPQSALPPASPQIGGLSAVGHGAFLRLENGQASWFGHAGGNEGYRCHLLSTCDNRSGAVVMTNGDRGNGLLAEIFEAIARECRWNGYVTDWQGPPALNVAAMERFTGDFALPSGNLVRCTPDGGDLLVAVGDQSPLKFVSNDGDTFASTQSETSLTLSEDDCLVLSQVDQVLRCPRIA